MNTTNHAKLIPIQEVVVVRDTTPQENLVNIIRELDTYLSLIPVEENESYEQYEKIQYNIEKDLFEYSLKQNNQFIQKWIQKRWGQ